MQWLPVVLFVLLGLIFAGKGLRRRARRFWAWGRMGEGAPLSRRSYVIFGTTFFAIASTLARAPEPGWIAVFLVGACFVAIIASGYADTRSARQRRIAKGKSGSEAQGG